MAQVNPYLLNKRGQFGTYGTQSNDETGGFSKGFVAQFSRWYGVRIRTMNQNYQIYNTELQDTIDIIVRHDSSIKIPMRFQDAQSNNYDIVGISPDDTANLNTLDVITLKAVDRKGTSKNV